MTTYFPHFQPFVSVSTGQIWGYEALARTINADGMVVSAGTLFSDPNVAPDKLLHIDRQVRTLAVASLADIPNCFLSLNILPQWIERLKNDYGTTPTIKMVEKHKIDPRRIVIEITEQAGDIANIKAAVNRYRAEGFKIAIDDFGAGRSDLDRVIALEPDYLKIDMKLFKTAALGGHSADVLLAITEMAERIGSTLVCEGVETENEFFFGLECGAELMQGFLFYPALPKPIERHSTLEQVSRLRRNFFNRKLVKQRRLVAEQRELKKRIMNLRDFLLTAPPELVCHANLDLNGFARFYICNLQGDQLSQSFDIENFNCVPDPAFIGYNWSWRPYFYQLAAMNDEAQMRTVTSRSYRDVSTRRPCKTTGVLLDSARVLLVDCYEDQIADQDIADLVAFAASR